MKTLARANAIREPASEVQEFEEALDRSYARFRARAALEWQRRGGGLSDPSDDCVSVRIGCAEEKILETVEV